MKREKILIFIPSYNVEKKIKKVLKKIPNLIFKKFNIKILIIEDNSKDRTLSIIREMVKKKRKKININLIANKENKGYGGVQKIAFKYAIRKKFKC